MRTLHFDCYAGISGDMCLGALVDLGADPDILRAELGKLGLGGWKLDFVRDFRGGIGGLRAVVDLGDRTDHNAGDEDDAYGQDQPAGHSHSHEDSPDHLHDHFHHHTHGHEPGHDHSGEHRDAGVHRSWRDIRALIEKSDVSGGAKKRALAIFTRIAEAEAQVHRVPVEEVAFHEVGALDSIIDILGTAICLELLGPDRISASEIELGGGMVRCAHGLLPVPAPATLILCRGLPVRTGGFNKEMTTPTGAAILAASAEEFITGPRRFREIKTGYGIGTRKTERPNLLRVSWREEEVAPGQDRGKDLITEELVLCEANIDDKTGEELGFLMERLFEAGALDVTLSPCVMKKSRPGTILSVLCPPAKLEALGLCMLRHGTIGFREIPVRRRSLPREEGRVTGPFGEVRVKTVFKDGKVLRSKIEYEDKARLAREASLSLGEVEDRIKDGGPW